MEQRLAGAIVLSCLASVGFRWGTTPEVPRSVAPMATDGCVEMASPGGGAQAETPRAEAPPGFRRRATAAAAHRQTAPARRASAPTKLPAWPVPIFAPALPAIDASRPIADGEGSGVRPPPGRQPFVPSRPVLALAHPMDPGDPPGDARQGESSLRWTGVRLDFGADIVFAGFQDNALHAAMGRERQAKLAYAVFSVESDLTDRVSFRVETNPVRDSVVPRPYAPSPDDRRTYFFPNQPEGRGVSSDPSGLYKVDFYKHPGLDPIIQQGLVRTAYVDVHDPLRRYGARIGRVYVPKGLGLDRIRWFTVKDLTHIQAINLVADAGAVFYLRRGPIRVDLAAIGGNGSPYHDYGYFDFTDPSEDKNSSFGAVLSGRLRADRYEIGASLQRNFVNSRIEDSITLQLSKHQDDAELVFGAFQPTTYLRLFGEYARYTWGLAPSSANLLPGPPVRSPVVKQGFYLGAAARFPAGRSSHWGLTFTEERLSRDDALVSWAAANELFGVELGRRERSRIVKFYGDIGAHLTTFFFVNALDNPFPELSAIRPIAGWGAGFPVSSTKIGAGIRLRMGAASEPR